MQPWNVVARAAAPDGAELVLARRGDEWVVRVAGRVLVSSRAHASEDALAAETLARVASTRPASILLGGLGLGFTLRALLDRLPGDARVVVAELVPALVDWNRGPAADLARRPLDDARVRLQLGDVGRRIGEAERAFDAIVLDVDNGPSALAHAANDRLYGDAGVQACARALRPGGVLAVWSAGRDEAYLERLRRAGLDAEALVTPAHASGGQRHVLLFGTRPRGRGPGGWHPRG